MELSEMLEKIREEIERDDKVREEILPMVREAIRFCSQSIKETHRGNYENAARFLKNANRVIITANQEMNKSSFLSKTRILDAAFQELAEASNVLSIIRDGEFTPPDVLDIPSRSFLTGLADVIGELRRAILDSIRTDDLEKGEKLFVFMETIFDELNGFDFPNALIPDLRKKCDVARGLVERTRGDLTLAFHQTRLRKQIENFEKQYEE